MMLGHFLTLSRRRVSSFSSVPNAISSLEIESYFRIHDIADFMSLVDFDEWISELDSEFGDYYLRLEKKKPKSPKPP